MKILNLEIYRYRVVNVRGISLRFYTDLGIFEVFIFRLNKRASLRSASYITFYGIDDFKDMSGHWSNEVSCLGIKDLHEFLHAIFMNFEDEKIVGRETKKIIEEYRKGYENNRSRFNYEFYL